MPAELAAIATCTRFRPDCGEPQGTMFDAFVLFIVGAKEQAPGAAVWACRATRALTPCAAHAGPPIPMVPASAAAPYDRPSVKRRKNHLSLFRMVAAVSTGACLVSATVPASATAVMLTGNVMSPSSFLVDIGPFAAILSPGADWFVNVADYASYDTTIDLTETSLSMNLISSVSVISDIGYRFTFTGLGISAAMLDLNTTASNVSLSIIDSNTFTVSIDKMSNFVLKEEIRFTLTPVATSVPEPTTLALVAATLIAGSAVRRRRIVRA